MSRKKNKAEAPASPDEQAPAPSVEPVEPDQQAEQPPVVELVAEPGSIEALQAERDDLLGRVQRVSADYLNYQKRAARDMEEARQYANADLAKAMLDVLDDLERAVEHARANHPEDDPLLVGTDLVYQKALAALKRFGVEPVESLGCPFDPVLHQAVLQQPTPDVEPMTVVAEAQRGYTLHGRIIRPTMVVVASAPEPAEDTAPDADEPTQEG